MPDTSTSGRGHYERGLAHLARWLDVGDDSALSGATTAFRAAAAASPGTAPLWAALGYALDAAREAEEALGCFERARALDPTDDVVEVFVLTLLSESGAEPAAVAAIEAAAERQGADLEALRRALREADFPVDSGSLLRNGFLHARNFLRSRLEDEIESWRRRSNPADAAAGGTDDLEECVAMQQELARELAAERVPAALAPAVPWAVRLGVGDDVCRGRLMGQLSDAERAGLLAVVRDHADGIHAWLDSFEEEPLSDEAAALMYLLLAVEDEGLGGRE